jgi:hypothetical protein
LEHLFADLEKLPAPPSLIGQNSPDPLGHWLGWDFPYAYNRATEYRKTTAPAIVAGYNAMGARLVKLFEERDWKVPPGTAKNRSLLRGLFSKMGAAGPQQGL